MRPIVNTYNYQDFEQATVYEGTESVKYTAGSIPISGAREYTSTDGASSVLIKACYTYTTLKDNAIVRNGDTVQMMLCHPNIDTSLENVKVRFDAVFNLSSMGTWSGMNIEYDVATQTYIDTPASNANLYYSDLQYHETVVDGVKYVVLSFVPMDDGYVDFSGFCYYISGTLPNGSSGETVEWSFSVDNPVTLEVTCNHVTSIEVSEVYVSLGESVQLTATVHGVGTYDNSVTWSKYPIYGQAGLTVTTDGFVTIAADATKTSWTVRAKSVQNPEIYTDVTVYLNTSEPTPKPDPDPEPEPTPDPDPTPEPDTPSAFNIRAYNHPINSIIVGRKEKI